MTLDGNLFAHLLLVFLCTIGLLLSYFHKSGDFEGRRFKFSAGLVVINYMILFGIIVPHFSGEQPLWAAVSSSVIMMAYLAVHFSAWAFGRRESR